MYVAISNRNNWWDTFGQQDHQSDEEQDTLKVFNAILVYFIEIL